MKFVQIKDLYVKPDLILYVMTDDYDWEGNPSHELTFYMANELSHTLLFETKEERDKYYDLFKKSNNLICFGSYIINIDRVSALRIKDEFIEVYFDTSYDEYITVDTIDIPDEFKNLYLIKED